MPRRSGGIGRRARLRIWCPQGCGGSSPPSDTNVSHTSGRASTDFGQLDLERGSAARHDPQVVGAMAERVGLTVDATVTIEPGGEFPHWTASPPSVRVDRRRWVTPWREVPDA